MSKWILFAHNGLEYGPVEEKELVTWIREKRVSVDDLARMNGSGGWELMGEINLFSPYFRDRPTPAGRIKKKLKNESEGLKENLINTISLEKAKAEKIDSSCQACSFMEGVERLHEEKKTLEEKLAEERGRLRELNLTLERWKKI